jgi:hypothetical protein
MKKQRIQVTKSEQILPNLSIVYDYDEPLTTREEFLTILNNSLNTKCEILIYKINPRDKKIVYVYKHDNITDYFLVGSITYLSKPHPLFKKRFQLKNWFKNFYFEYFQKENTRIWMLGIYHYKGLYIFADFNINDYINRKLNSSAAHIYTNDLYQGLTNNLFKKIDKNNNHIQVISNRFFKEYINGKTIENPIFKLFKKFNKNFAFGKWIPADYAIKKMKDSNFYQWKGTEWPGWFLEYEFSSFIIAENCHGEMIYLGNNKDKKLLDFDIFFPIGNFYGDLKASDINKDKAPGNDQYNVLEAINRYQKLWYVIYEHNTKKDILHNNEMALKRMKLLGVKKLDGNISYAKKMKHSVEFVQMKIFELNRVNLNETLSNFNQGHQPNGGKRAPKFLINKNNIDNFIIFSYEYDKNLYKSASHYSESFVADSGIKE